uniref:Uncharacterized protein n=1 Tax=Oryza meridionalis TaxID=40149 RepID=A0A0E0DYL1_9ORYZ
MADRAATAYSGGSNHPTSFDEIRNAAEEFAVAEMPQPPPSVALPPVRRVFLFPSPPQPPPPPFRDVVRALRDSLEAVLPAFYPFAGALVYSPEEEDEEEGSLSIVVEAGGGVEFVEAETDLDFERLVDEGEEHDEDALRQLVPDIRRDELPAPVMAAQLMEFVGGGGGVAVHHAATDGRSLWRFLEMWSPSAATAAMATGMRHSSLLGVSHPFSSSSIAATSSPCSISTSIKLLSSGSRRLKLLPLPLQLAVNPHRSW